MQISNHNAAMGAGVTRPASGGPRVSGRWNHAGNPCPVQVPACPISIHRGAARAFTLVEVLVAVALIGFTMLALLAGFRQSFGMVAVVRENLRATQVLQEKMEMIRLFNWNQITNPGYIPTSFIEPFDPTAGTNNDGVDYIGTVSVANAPITETYASDMRLVTISLQWTADGVVYNRDMTTLVSRYGLQNYIY